MVRRPGWERPISEGGVTWIHFGANIGAADGKLSLQSASDDLRQLTEAELGGANVSTDMYPGGAPVRNRAFPPWSARHEVVETEMAEFMTAIGGEDHVAGWRGRDQRTQ